MTVGIHEDIGGKQKLLPLLGGVKEEILSLSIDWDLHQAQILSVPKTYAEKLILW